MSELALPSLMNLLEQQLRDVDDSSSDALSQTLRTLQRMGVARQDLVVHLERERARNEATEQDALFEDSCLRALELVAGFGRTSLEWSAAETAAAWLPRYLRFEDLRAGIEYALAPVDLLPKRPQTQQAEHHREISARLWAMLTDRSYVPTPGEFYQSPRSGLTTRPAALLAPLDRVVYEGLAQSAAGALANQVPPQVIWPRGRSPYGAHEDFTNAPAIWRTDYVVRTDIENFFASISHSLLAVLSAQSLALGNGFSVAVEGFLGSVMPTSVGIPQGPPGSDILASAFLIDIDLELQRREWDFVRYADDYLFAADSVADAKGKLADLELLMSERGLRLSGPKTRIIRRSTYLKRIVSPSDRFTRLRKQILQARRESIVGSEEPDEIKSGLRDAGVSDELLFDLMYHQTVSLEEVLDQLAANSDPTEAEIYFGMLKETAQDLERGVYPEKLNANERDIRSCILHLAARREQIPLHWLSSILDWMPSLIRDVSLYLEAIADLQTSEVAAFISDRLAAGHDSDLVAAWLLSAGLGSTALIVELDDTLQSVTLGAGQLSRAVSVLALATVGGLSAQTWQRVLDDAPAALRAEMALAADAGAGIYPRLLG